MDPYLIGTDKGIELNVTIINKREDAFETVFELEIPPDVEYVITEGIKVIRKFFVQFLFMAKVFFFQMNFTFAMNKCHSKK